MLFRTELFVKDIEAHGNQEHEHQRRNVPEFQSLPQRKALNIDQGPAQRPWDIM